MDDLKWILHCVNKHAHIRLYAERITAYQCLILDEDNAENKMLVSVEMLASSKESVLTLTVVLNSIKRNFLSSLIPGSVMAAITTDIRYGWAYPYEKEYQDFKKTIHPEGKDYLLYV